MLSEVAVNFCQLYISSLNEYNVYENNMNFKIRNEKN